MRPLLLLWIAATGLLTLLLSKIGPLRRLLMFVMSVMHDAAQASARDD